MSSVDDALLAIALLAIVLAVWQWLRARQAAVASAQSAAERADLTIADRELRAEQAAATATMSGLAEASTDALLVLDESRRIIWGNGAAWTMFGAAHPATGELFISLVRDADLNQAVIDAASGRRSIVRQAVLDERTLRIHAVPIEPDGRLAVAIADVTELQRLGRARRDLVGNISHELRTPLANIDLAAQTLRNGGLNDPVLGPRMLDQIQSHVQTLSQLSQEMMDLTMIESGQVLLKLLPTELAPLAGRVVELFLPQAKLKGQALTIDIPADIVVLADEQQVARVIGNLMQNAVKFTPEGGAVTLSARWSGAEDVEIAVADTGPGIPEAEQQRVFERFYKQDRARSRGGTGLGLAIARHIVEGHGGRIWVESVPGRGARFAFTLPRA